MTLSRLCRFSEKETEDELSRLPPNMSLKPAKSLHSDEPPNDESPSESIPTKAASFKEWPDLNTAPGDDVVKLKAVRVVDFQGRPVEILLTTQSASVEIEFVVLQGGKYLQPGLIFTDALGNTLFWTIDTDPILRRTPWKEEDISPRC